MTIIFRGPITVLWGTSTVNFFQGFISSIISLSYFFNILLERSFLVLGLQLLKFAVNPCSHFNVHAILFVSLFDNLNFSCFVLIFIGDGCSIQVCSL